MQSTDAKRRERRVLVAGIVISAILLVTRFAVLPLVQRWNAREQMIDFGAERIARMRSLIAEDARLRTQLSTNENVAGPRLISARTVGLAGSEIQSAIQSAAEESRITVSRVDIAGTPDSSANSAFPVIPVTVTGVGDIYGLSDFLVRMGTSSPVVQMKELSVVSNSSLRGGLLQITVRLGAPVVIE